MAARISPLSRMGSLRKTATESNDTKQDNTAYCGRGHQRWQEEEVVEFPLLRH